MIKIKDNYCPEFKKLRTFLFTNVKACTKIKSTQFQTSNVFTPAATNFLNNRSYNSSIPKAYLNWILFDDQFNMVGTGSGAQQVGANVTFTVMVQTGITATKNGFLYVYVSNETPNINVYFDNLQVTHMKSPLLQEQSYYPFGLQMAGISDKALGKLDSKNKFDGGVNFEEDYGVNLYSTFFRNYDPQIGRFDGVDVLSERTFGISVYGYCGNDPTMFIDPRGSEKAITQNEFDMMLASPNGGIWSASGGMELFGSQDEAFMFGALHYGGGGESSGGGGTFEQMLNRYNGGNLTSSLVAAFFKFTWGSEASDITAYAIAGGFNVGFTATSTGNHYSNDFFSTKSILSSFNFLTTLYNGKEDALFDQNRQNAWGITTKIASDFDYSTVTTMDVMTTSLAASKELSAETFHIISDVPVLKQFGVASSVIGAIDHGAKFLQDPNWKDGLEFLGNTALLAAHVLVPEATLAVDAAEFIYNNVTSLVDLFTDD